LLPTGNFLPQGNESGNKLPPSKVISGGFNEALGFFQKNCPAVCFGKCKEFGQEPEFEFKILR